MMFPHRSLYEKLYAKYLLKADDSLLVVAKLKSGETVADLCAGGLRMSHAAVRMGAKQVTAVDHSSGMMLTVPEDSPIGLHYSTVEDFLLGHSYPHRKGITYDVIVCSQAINYWLSSTTATWVKDLMSPKSRFVFNTFNTAPPERPTTNSYYLDGRFYMETVYRVDKMVYHLQSAEGLQPHYTEFAWISPEEFEKMLTPNFRWARVRKNKTDIYVCWRKDYADNQDKTAAGTGHDHSQGNSPA